MIITYINPPREDWDELALRASSDEEDITSRVEEIVRGVQKGGDDALREITARIEGREAGEFEVSDGEFARAEEETPPELREAIDVAAENIRRFHEAQRPAGIDLETGDNVFARRGRR